jgi:flagellum-specific peptidoglycan hydrolase FlgJ
MQEDKQPNHHQNTVHMKSSKFSNIPMDIIDTRFQHLAKRPEPQPQYASSKRLPDLELGTLLLLVLQQLAIGLRKPMLALKFHAKELLKGLFKRYPHAKKLPWLKLCVLAMVAFILFKKDMQFNFAMKAPMPVYFDDEEDDAGNTAQTSIAQTVSLTSNTDNPYAPAEPSSLRDIQVRDFVRSYGPLAIEEMHQSGIPASITIAQALVESRCGKSKLATQNNNFFGIKCFSKECPKGHCTNATDDHHKDFFRKYPHASKSFRHHSQILSQGRYKYLLRKGKDYEAWARGLKKEGYATDRTYDQKLIDIIEEYKLYNLDKQ